MVNEVSAKNKIKKVFGLFVVMAIKTLNHSRHVCRKAIATKFVGNSKMFWAVFVGNGKMFTVSGPEP